MFVSLGEALIDLIPSSGSSLQQATELTIQPGGAPLNVAIALQRLDIPVTFLGTLSSDAFGRRLAELLDTEGITRLPTASVARPTRLAVVDHSVADGGSFRFYGERPADTQVTMADVDEAFNGPVSGLYVTSLLFGHEDAAVTQRYAVEQAVKRTVPVFTDPNPRVPAWPDQASMESAVRWLLAHCDYAKLSIDDARALGWSEEPERLIENLATESAARIVVTDGERGCWAMMDGHINHVPAPSVQAVDPTGAGDVFFAALIAGVLTERELTVDVLTRACAAGAIAATVQGGASALASTSISKKLQPGDRKATS